jgi:hypothetical protein
MCSGWWVGVSFPKPVSCPYCQGRIGIPATFHTKKNQKFPKKASFWHCKSLCDKCRIVTMASPLVPSVNRYCLSSTFFVSICIFTTETFTEMNPVSFNMKTYPTVVFREFALLLDHEFQLIGLQRIRLHIKKDNKHEKHIMTKISVKMPKSIAFYLKKTELINVISILVKYTLKYICVSKFWNFLVGNHFSTL